MNLEIERVILEVKEAPQPQRQINVTGGMKDERDPERGTEGGMKGGRG